MPITDPFAELKRRLHEVPRWNSGSVVVVTGSGVSVQASSGMSNGRGAAASWKGLLRLAVECVDRQRKRPLRWNAAPLLAKLASDVVSTSDLLSVASTVEAALRKADAFRTFLDETIGQLEPAAPQVLHAVGQLGVPIATTNYDGLIEQTHELQPLTWQHPAYVDEWLKGTQPGVLHLHGHFRAVDSVVLGRESYKKTISDGHAQNVLRSLFQQRTLLFVGMGGGLDDPNFGALLDWAIDARLPTDCFHVLLLREMDAAKAHARYSIETGIRVLSYGSEYSDLVPYLRSLLRTSAEPVTASAAATAHAVPDRSALQRQIGVQLPTDSDLDSFCLNYFPHLYQRFTRGMNRTEKESLLLRREQDFRGIDARLAALRNPADSAIVSAHWSSLASPREGVQSAVFTALTRLDRKTQWRAIRHDLSLKPQANRLVLLRASGNQNLKLFVQRIEKMLTHPSGGELNRSAVSVRHIPFQLMNSKAERASTWNIHLSRVLAESGGRDGGTPSERLAEATTGGPLILSLVFTSDPPRLLRVLTEARQAALRDFLTVSLPKHLLGVQGVTVLLPLELVDEAGGNSPSKPLWPAALEWVRHTGGWQDTQQHPDATQRLLCLDELPEPTWADVEDYFWSHQPPLPNPQRMLDKMRPLFDRMRDVNTTYEQLAEAIDSLIADHT
jgi:hypothetical protein